MDNFTYKKEQLIWIKEDFLTDELCFDITEIIDSIIDENLPIKDEFFSRYKNWNKIKIFLLNSLNYELINYMTMVNSKMLFTSEKTNIANFITLQTDFVDNKNWNFIIQKNKDNKIERVERFNVINEKIKIKILKYIIFLDDYEGEIVFWNEYKIQPRKGDLLLFPVSWCFPYYENIKKYSNKIIMCGFIYRCI